MSGESFADHISRDIVSLLARHGGMTRGEIAGHLKLSKGRISVATGLLLQQGLIEEYAQVASKRRPASLLRLHSGYAAFIGISLHDHEATAVAIDPNGNILARTYFDRAQDYATCLSRIQEAVAFLRSGCPAGTTFRAAGLALPAYISTDRELCITSSVLGWENKDVRSDVSTAIDLPVFIENDTNSLALYEKMFGEIQSVKNFSIAAVGDGIGIAYTIAGTVHHGEYGGAGELAHLPANHGLLDEPLRPCRCGNRGCLETIASTQAIKIRAREENLPPDLLQLSALARDGNAAALRILHTAANSLGYAIASLIQVLDPQYMIIALENDLVQSVFSVTLKQFIEHSLMPGFNRHDRVRIRQYDNTIWAIGAAGLALQNHLFGTDS